MESRPTILQKIAAKRKESFPERFSKERIDLFLRKIEGLENPRDFYSALLLSKTWSLIAEIKARSPSKGTLLAYPNPVEWAILYERAGAGAISIVTEENFFGGKPEWIQEVKKVSKLSVLRKDFLTTPEDILESRAMGADAVLLIAAILEEKNLVELTEKIFSLGMEPLIEIHNEKEAAAARKTRARLIGINNRNLHDFSVDLETTQRLLPLLKDRTVICESGIFSVHEIRKLHSQGVKVFLVGEALLTSKNPERILAELLGKTREDEDEKGRP